MNKTFSTHVWGLGLVREGSERKGITTRSSPGVAWSAGRQRDSLWRVQAEGKLLQDVARFPDSSGSPREQMPADLLGALSKAILPLLCLSGPCLVGAGQRRAPSHPSWCHREPLRGDPAGASGSRVTPCLAQPTLAKHVHSAVLCKVPDASK